MRHRRWLELVKDNDCYISYHTGKANVVADALSRKHAVIAHLSLQRPLQADIQIFELALYARGNAPDLATLIVLPTLRDRIQVKAEQQRSVGKLRPLPIPEWKWENISMDFVAGLPRTTEGFNSIWLSDDILLMIKLHFNQSSSQHSWALSVDQLQMAGEYMSYKAFEGLEILMPENHLSFS
ncbi:uncharacterized protein LOC142550633 [Primulina tabacum]|uniref:uncharacterized protein LOC142550633 n=1 Tax=Primulina tabacum TaxID=48773 RepID=UPI003F5935B1